MANVRFRRGSFFHDGDESKDQVSDFLAVNVILKGSGALGLVKKDCCVHSISSS